MATYSQVCSNVGSFTYGNRFTLYVVLTNRNGDPATNKSVVDYNVYFENTSGGGTFTSRTRLYFALNGGGIEDTTSEITGPRNGSVTVASGSTTIDHNNDGTKSISFHALVQSATFGIKGEISGTFTLNTIPRASSVSGGSGNIGGETEISVSRASTSFTHTLRYAFGSLSGTIATGVWTSYTWIMPTSFYAQIPNSKTGIGTIYCDTYNGTTLIGTKSTPFTATVTEDSSRPTVSATLTDINETTKALTGNVSKMVKGKSTGQLVITSSVKNSATIKSVTVNGTNVGSAASITKTYANISTASFTIVTTDSRGFTNTSYVLTPSYVNYVPLTLNTTIFRPQPTGTEIQMTYSGNYFNGSFGSVANTLSITWKYRVQGASSWTNGGTITPTLSGNTISSKTISLGTNYNYQTAYDFQITAVDKLTTNTQTIAVSVGMPVFYWGKDFFNVTVPINGVDITKLSVDKNFDSGDLNNLPYYGTGLFRCRFGCTNTPTYSGVENVHWYLIQNVWAAGAYANQIATPVHGDLRLYFRTCVNGNWSAWKTIQEAPVSLFDNPSGTTGTLQLSESAANFSYLEIYYNINGTRYLHTKIFNPNGKLALLSGTWANDAGIIQIETRDYLISGTSITPKIDEWFANLTIDGVSSFGKQVQITINKVVGYR